MLGTFLSVTYGQLPVPFLSVPNKETEERGKENKQTNIKTSRRDKQTNQQTSYLVKPTNVLFGQTNVLFGQTSMRVLDVLFGQNKQSNKQNKLKQAL